MAMGYSLEGLKHATASEPAFQQELIILAVMTLVAAVCPFSFALKVAIAVSHLFILVVELLNSAIEAIVDMASPDYNALAKQSKDMASAAVLLAFVISALVWSYAIYEVVA